MISHARCGARWRDQKLAFWLAGFGVIGRRRRRTRDFFFKMIERFTQHGLVRLDLRINRQLSRFEMRGANESDYLIGGELVRGSYPVPASAPEAIVDAGANIGLFSIHASRFFPKARLTCYEPDASNLAQLQKNLSLNQIQAQVEPAGVWSKDITLFYHAQTSATGYVTEQPSNHPIVCKLPAIGPECWLKLDVEGAEHEVLPALFASRDYPRWISMEIHECNVRGAALLSLLREHGYKIKGDLDLTRECITISAERKTAEKFPA
jgi:FkbM family methyltransferase